MSYLAEYQITVFRISRQVLRNPEFRILISRQPDQDLVTRSAEKSRTPYNDIRTDGPDQFQTASMQCGSHYVVPLSDTQATWATESIRKFLYGILRIHENRWLSYSAVRRTGVCCLPCRPIVLKYSCQARSDCRPDISSRGVLADTLHTTLSSF